MVPKRKRRSTPVIVYVYSVLFYFVSLASSHRIWHWVAWNSCFLVIAIALGVIAFKLSDLYGVCASFGKRAERGPVGKL